MTESRQHYQCSCDDGRELTVDVDGPDVWLLTKDPTAGVLLVDREEVERLRDQLNDWLERN